MQVHYMSNREGHVSTLSIQQGRALHKVHYLSNKEGHISTLSVQQGRALHKVHYLSNREGHYIKYIICIANQG